tara:strand:+ start:363 stop:530 length:168 start_codon:yes stop_codon:yes gene_type:complete
MVGDDVSVMLDGWCKVFHQFTENFIIGKLNNPIIAIIEDILLALLKSFINIQDKI